MEDRENSNFDIRLAFIEPLIYAAFQYLYEELYRHKIFFKTRTSNSYLWRREGAVMMQEPTKREGAKTSHPDLQNARELMSSGQFDEVLPLLETLPESTQQIGWVQLLRARALMKTGDPEQSLIALDAAAHAGMPEIPVLELRSVLQEQMNDLEGLLGTMARLVELDPNNLTLRARRPGLHQARELISSGQFEEVLRLLERLPESTQQAGWVQLMRARALMKTGDPEQSLIALDAAAHAGMPEIPVLELRSALQEQMNDLEGLLVTMARLVEFNPNNLALHFRRATKMRDMGRAEEAKKAAQTARDLAPEDPATHGLVCKIAVHFGDIEGFAEALEYALAHLPGSLPPDVSNLRMHLLMIPEQYMGDLPARVEARWPESLSIQESKRLPPAPQETWRRPLVQQQEAAAFLCSPPGDNDITIVWFSGIGSDFNTLQPVDTHAAAAGCNAIYVSPRPAIYLPVDRSKDPLTALLRAEIAKFRTKKLIVCGTSLGAVPALFYGLALKADRVISLSGPNTARPDQLAEMGDRRGTFFVKSLQRKIPWEQLDFRPALLAASKAKSRKPFRYDIYYGANRPTDRRHAEWVADIRGVRLFPIEGFTEHNSFTGLIDRGRAGEIFTV